MGIGVTGEARCARRRRRTGSPSTAQSAEEPAYAGPYDARRLLACGLRALLDLLGWEGATLPARPLLLQVAKGEQFPEGRESREAAEPRYEMEISDEL